MLLSCEVSSATVPVTWKKDNTVLVEGGRHILKKNGAVHSLEIEKLCAEDAGEYSCISRGKKTVAKLIVRGEFKLYFYQPFFNILFQPINSSRMVAPCLTCEKGACHPCCCEIHSISSPSLNHQPYTASSSPTERVRIITALKDVTVTAGEDAKFTCELSHEGVNEGVWWLGSSPLQNNEMNQMMCRGRLHLLILTMTTPEETGTVAFVVGEERTSARLSVIPRAKGKEKVQLELGLDHELK